MQHNSQNEKVQKDKQRSTHYLHNRIISRRGFWA